MDHLDQVQNEYSNEFCFLLETAYGGDFLSEGGTEAIDDIVNGFENDIKNKKILEIGCGYGGAAQYLAKKYDADVTGLEINQRMVDDANRRVPKSLLNKVRIHFYDDVTNLPFANAQFDFLLTKEVLLHLDTDEKRSLFKEVNRVIKPEKYFVLLEWLSPISGTWGKRVQEIARLDGLTLFAHTEDDYRRIAKEAGLELVAIDSRNKEYARYNHEIAEHLKEKCVSQRLREKCSDGYIQRNIYEFELLSQAIIENELLVRRIVLKKDHDLK